MYCYNYYHDEVVYVPLLSDDATETCFSYIWDVTILEYLICILTTNKKICLQVLTFMFMASYAANYCTQSV